jgi:hypothetical protein
VVYARAKVDSGRDQMKELQSDYFESVNSYKEKCPLDFWKMHEEKYKPLAQLAKIYLGVPASSASVERIFSISGHILSSKRASMSVRLFANLVFLKLNENYI